MTMRPRRAAIVLAAALLTLTACAADAGAPAAAPDATEAPAAVSAQEVLTERGWEGLDGAALIAELDQLPVAERPATLMASVTANAVTVSGTDGVPTEIPVDKGFYLSIAPYVTQTHPCGFHSLTTCRGELANTDVQLTVTDAATGEVITDEGVRTYDNGFVGVWLPYDRELTVTVTGEAGTATTTLTTGAEDPTCLTTLQLL